MKSLLLLLLFAVPAFTQLPDRGTINDLKGKSKVYVVADAERLGYIEKVLKKTFSIVPKPAEAEFFVEYKTLHIKEVTSMKIDLETGQLDAYIYRDNQKVIAWSQSMSKGGTRTHTSAALAKRFVKAFKH